MISRASDYVFVTGANVDVEHPHGDLDRISITGDIMPNLPLDPYPFRGEDIAFLTEAARERAFPTFENKTYSTFSRKIQKSQVDFILNTIYDCCANYGFYSGAGFIKPSFPGATYLCSGFAETEVESISYNHFVSSDSRRALGQLKTLGGVIGDSLIDPETLRISSSHELEKRPIAEAFEKIESLDKVIKGVSVPRSEPGSITFEWASNVDENWYEYSYGSWHYGNLMPVTVVIGSAGETIGVPIITSASCWCYANAVIDFYDRDSSTGSRCSVASKLFYLGEMTRTPGSDDIRETPQPYYTLIISEERKKAIATELMTNSVSGPPSSIPRGWAYNAFFDIPYIMAVCDIRDRTRW